jgi:hypothetical protein
MGTTAWIVTGAVLVVAVIAAVSFGIGGHRRRQVQDLFGPDYERVAEIDLAQGADADLGQRHQVSLEPEVAERYRSDWDRVQTGFVDRPAMALHEADALVSGVMLELGYAVDRLDRLGEPDATAPPPVQRYRAIQRVNLRADSSETTTDELRQAFVEYRNLLDDLLRPASPAGAGRPVAGRRAPTGRQVRS